MNCFAHALPYLDDPAFAVGTCLPDWMPVIDRKVRFRSHRLQPLMEEGKATERALFAGIQRHLHDDRWFHATDTFAQLNSRFSMEIKSVAPHLAGIQTHFTGHLLIEVLIDHALDQAFPGKMATFYRQLDRIDGQWLSAMIERYAGKANLPIAHFFDKFREARFLFDYRENDRLRFRLNQVMKRVQLPELPASLEPWFDSARRVVRSLMPQLLLDYPVAIGNPVRLTSEGDVPPSCE